MAGILANSASVSMTEAIRHGVIDGFVINEVVTLTFTDSPASSYFWYMEGPPLSHVALNNRQGPAPTFRPDFIGEYTIGLIADDRFYTLKLTARPGVGVGGIEAIAIAAGEDIAAITAANPGRRFVLGVGSHTISASIVDPNEDPSRIKMLAGTTLNIANDLTVNAGMDLSEGGLIVIAAGKVLTHGGPVIAPDSSQIWSLGAGSSVVAKIPHVTPEHFGALADGTTDDTVAIQAACDCAVVSRGCEVVFTASTYVLSAMVQIDRARGLKLRGSGPGHQAAPSGTYIKWIGAAPGEQAAFLFYNANYPIIEDLLIQGTVNVPDSVFEFQGDNNDPDLDGIPANSPVMRRVKCYVTAPIAALWSYASGAPGANNDMGRFEHCDFQGQTEANIQLGTATSSSPNMKQFLVTHCVLADGNYGVKVYQGTFAMISGFVALHAAADFWFNIQVQDSVTLNAVRSESSAMFLETAAAGIGTGIAGALNLIGCTYSHAQINVNNYAIKIGSPGPVTIDGCTLGELENGKPPPLIYCRAANFSSAGEPVDPAIVTVRGCLFASARDADSAADVNPFVFNGDNYRLYTKGNLYARKTPPSLYTFEHREDSDGRPTKAVDLDALRALPVNLLFEGDTVLVGSAVRYAWMPSTGTDIIDDSHSSVRPDALARTEDGLWSLVNDHTIIVDTFMDLRRLDPERFANAVCQSKLVLGDTLGETFVYETSSSSADDNAATIAPSDYVAFVSEFDLTDASWVKQFTTITGTDTIVDTTDNQVHDIAATAVGATTGVNVVFEFDIKAVPGSPSDDILFVINNGNELANYDSATGAVNSTVGTITANAGVATLDGWYRCQVTVAFSGADHTTYFVLKQFSAYVGDGMGAVSLRRIYMQQKRTTDGRWLRVS